MSLYDGATIEASPPFDEMGIEPLGPDLSGAVLAGLFRGKKTPLKAALLDQRLVAGLGNIYVCEALFRSRLSPQAPAGSLVTATGRPKAKAHALSDAIKAVLEEAVTHGGSTLRDHAQVDGTAGAMQERFRVYDREGKPCFTPGCRGVVGRLVQSGRSTFHCPVCQT
jgi:formamidopyrimidine-DNA glycosylase